MMPQDSAGTGGRTRMEWEPPPSPRAEARQGKCPRSREHRRIQPASSPRGECQSCRLGGGKVADSPRLRPEVVSMA